MYIEKNNNTYLDYIYQNITFRGKMNILLQQRKKESLLLN